MHISEIVKLKFPDADLVKNIQIFDDGQGAYIKKWDNSLGVKPDAAQLVLWQAEIQAQHDLNVVLRARKEEYPKIDELIVALWEKVIENNPAPANDLEIKRQAVKEKYPK